MERRHPPSKNPRSQLPANWPYAEYKPGRFERSMRFAYRHRAFIGSITTTAALLAVLYTGTQNHQNTNITSDPSDLVQEAPDQGSSDGGIQPAEASAPIDDGYSLHNTLEGAALASAVVAGGVVLLAWSISKNQYNDSIFEPKTVPEDQSKPNLG